jgi:hypothetical protein
VQCSCACSACGVRSVWANGSAMGKWGVRVSAEARLALGLWRRARESCGAVQWRTGSGARSKPPGDVKYPVPVARGRRSGAPVCVSLRWLVKQRVACFLRMGAVANGAGCGLTSGMHSEGCAETLTVQAYHANNCRRGGCGWDADVSEPLMQFCFVAKMSYWVPRMLLLLRAVGDGQT